MPRPEPTWVTLEIDGREVRAPEGAMLVDGAKYGDVEIPVFCYEPKLGAPVGACRMCLVEIEGIPKLQTACSTAVKDGMVVTTKSDRVVHAQNAVVEFLLVNHPLDCPVCDKGGECPLQDVTMGWGAGRSRFIEPKRHFKKPLELSPLVAIDRERCILCFRCVRFSQEISEDYQLVFVERGSHTYVGTHDGHPYVAPFSGNITELCPVGALTSTSYRFRARPWDIEGSGSICSLCPSQCNVEFTVRDDTKVLRVLARDNVEVDDGWLCDKGRYGYQAMHAKERLTEPMVRDGGALRAVPWERALSEAAAGLKRAGAGTAALVGGEATNEEGFLVQRMLREQLGSPHVDSRAGGPLDPEHARLLSRPDLGATVSDIDHAGAVLVVESELVEESPILDLRVRKAARRHGARVVVLTSRAGALDPNADAIVRFAPGAGEAALAALGAALGEDPELATRSAGGLSSGEEPRDEGGFPDQGPDYVAAGAEQRTGEGDGDEDEGLVDRVKQVAEVALDAVGSVIGKDLLHDDDPGDPDRPALTDRPDELGGLPARAGADPEALRAAAALLRAGGPTVVLWGERIGHGHRGRQGLAALLALAGRLDVAGTEGSGLLEVPAATNARGLREVGCLPGVGPGLVDAATAGHPAHELPGAIGEDVSALLLFGADPLRTHPERGRWERALDRATFVVAFSDFVTPALAEHAAVVFPAESYAEKEGTMTHPDGRLQRLRQAIAHPGEVRPGWNVLAELGQRLEWRVDVPEASPAVSAEMIRSVPFYEGLTLEEIGGRGVRWPDREQASALARVELPDTPLEEPPLLGTGLRLGVRSTLWSGRETEHAPILRFLAPRQRAEMSAEDARRLGIAPGDDVEVRVNGSSVRAVAALREGQAAGSVFLLQGTEENNATALLGAEPSIVELSRAGR